MTVVSEKGTDSKNLSECGRLRNAYNECFNRYHFHVSRRVFLLPFLSKQSVISFYRWYTDKYLKGKRAEMECFAEWEAYKSCVSRYMEEKKLSHVLQVDESIRRGFARHQLFSEGASE
eukprot:TRINITY_DN3390_c0_g1_i2.p1 TRINITY_DN3390_c0_g1~~TRINITY_DN3390_c0_g1_i2.p1  ORF type:complete len:118 (+),score=18.87 TRINITY_DN3390_c0_g1_i2:45-398(+)